MLDSQDQHVSLSGSALDKNLVNMDGILKENRRNLLSEHFVEGASRSDVPMTVLIIGSDRRLKCLGQIEATLLTEK